MRHNSLKLRGKARGRTASRWMTPELPYDVSRPGCRRSTRITLRPRGPRVLRTAYPKAEELPRLVSTVQPEEIEQELGVVTGVIERVVGVGAHHVPIVDSEGRSALLVLLICLRIEGQLLQSRSLQRMIDDFQHPPIREAASKREDSEALQ